MKTLKYISVVGLLLIGVFALSPPGQIIFAQGGDFYNKWRDFQDMVKIINTNYVEEVDWDKTMLGAQNGLMEALDPHSVFIGADRTEQINESFRGDFEGIGIEFDIIEDYITVITPHCGAHPLKVCCMQEIRSSKLIMNPPTRSPAMVSLKSFVDPRDHGLTSRLPAWVRMT